MGLIERPPRLFRALLPGGIFRPVQGAGERRIYLTFDDGPIPEATPWVLDTLRRYGVKATFFMVADNARRYPELVERVHREGHAIGNHTMHHLQGAKVGTRRYIRDIIEGAAYLPPTDLFRPPHGWLRPGQLRLLREHGYRVVMYDLVTRDYSRRLSARDVFENVKRYARPGSIIVFHDSLRSIGKLPEALPAAIEWLKGEGYEFATL